MQKLEQQVLDIFTDIAGFSERGGVTDGERDIDGSCQGFREQGLASSGATDQQDVALVDFDFDLFLVGFDETLVVIVHGHRKSAFRLILTDHVVIEEFLDFSGGRNRLKQLSFRGDAFFFLLEDVLAEIGALAADVDVAGAFDHRADFTGRLSTE